MPSIPDYNEQLIANLAAAVHCSSYDSGTAQLPTPAYYDDCSAWLGHPNFASQSQSPVPSGSNVGGASGSDFVWNDYSDVVQPQYLPQYNYPWNVHVPVPTSYPPSSSTMDFMGNYSTQPPAWTNPTATFPSAVGPVSDSAATSSGLRGRVSPSPPLIDSAASSRDICGKVSRSRRDHRYEPYETSRGRGTSSRYTPSISHDFICYGPDDFSSSSQRLTRRVVVPSQDRPMSLSVPLPAAQFQTENTRKRKAEQASSSYPDAQPKAKRPRKGKSCRPSDPSSSDTASPERPKKRTNCFFRFRGRIAKCLEHKPTYGMSHNEATAVTARMWHMMSKEGQQPYREDYRNKKAYVTYEIPEGACPFDEVPMEDVLEALRHEARAAVDPQNAKFDVHVDATREQRKRWREKSIKRAEQFIAIRERLWRVYQERTGIQEDAPPVFTLDDALWSGEDLTHWLKQYLV